MKAHFPTLLGVTLLLIGGSMPIQAGDDSFAIARDRSIAGKRISGACLPFAQDLYSRLTKAGGEAHLVVFNWRSPAGITGTHAIVVYRDKEGRYWAMDNLQTAPLWLAGSTPAAWASFFAPRYAVEVKGHKMDPALAGQYADRSRSTETAAVRTAGLLASN